jgi:tetratricopeptide (TPR) repeat protein/GR25 family glycosyltransferase involved in LPS biosynthesis
LIVSIRCGIAPPTAMTFDPGTILQQALAAFGRDDFAAAERLCRDALAADRHVFDAHHLLALVQLRLGRPQEALANCERAVELRPDEPLALANRAVALDALGRYEEAVASNDRALANRPAAAATWSNRGNALGALGRFDDALASYDRALALEPDFADCRFNRALLLLRRGAFAEGWREYEWRRRLADWPARAVAGPEWRGETLAGRRLLLYGEGRLEDALQFARFVPLLAARSGDIVCEVEPPLAGLMRSLRGAAQIVERGDAVPPCDCHLPLASLPVVLGIEEAQIPAAIPYLTAEPERVARWAERLPPGAFRVGVAWRGGRRPDRGDRPLPLAAFAPLGRIPGVQLIGLEARTELAASVPIVDLATDFVGRADGWLDLAAIVARLDLVVTADGPIAHLAGALGRPVWILLQPETADWRWLLDRADSPWYPTARLFRRRRRGDWPELAAQAADALARLVADKTGAPAAMREPAPGAVGAAIPACVINLVRRPDRRERFLSRHADHGLDIAVFDAVDGRGLDRPALVTANVIADPAVQFNNSAIGLAMSHRSLWQLCRDRDAPLLVFEDDAFISRAVAGFTARIKQELDGRCDLLYLGYNMDAVFSLGFAEIQWANLFFDPQASEFSRLSREFAEWSDVASHTVVDVRLAWGTLAYAISPRGASVLLQQCFPLSGAFPIRMHGSGKTATAYGIDGVMMSLVQRGFIKARAFFPPLAISPNDPTDSDVNPPPHAAAAS